MADIVEELTIEASPQRVFNALTKADEIVCWWSDEAYLRDGLAQALSREALLMGRTTYESFAAI